MDLLSPLHPPQLVVSQVMTLDLFQIKIHWYVCELENYLLPTNNYMTPH